MGPGVGRALRRGAASARGHARRASGGVRVTLAGTTLFGRPAGAELGKRAGPLTCPHESAIYNSPEPIQPPATRGSVMNVGYDRPLYILPFDHRGTFQSKMFG